MYARKNEVKKPVRATCNVLCTDIRTMINHEICCDKCNELNEMTKNNFYGVIFDKVI
jgi:hypothetical protein